MSNSVTGSGGRPAGRAWGVLLVLCGAIFLEGIDVAMLNVALPSIRADLGLSTGMLSGVVSAYVLGYGGFMLLGGRAADLLGHRRMFVLWLAVFLVFSGLGGLATEGWTLLAARFVTGVAAAFMAPAGLALVTSAFPEGPARTRALGVYAGTAAGGFSLGVVAGGALASLGWRWVFFAPVVLSALILVAALVLVRDARAERSPDGFDLAGAFTLTGAMLLLVYGVVRLERAGDGPFVTAGVFAAALALLRLFARVERRSPSPLVRPGLLRTAPLVRVNAAALLFLAAFAGFQFLATLYFQELRGWSTMQTGLAMLVIGLDTVLAPVLTPRLVNRFGNTRVLLAGIVVAAVAYALFLPVGMDWTYVAMLPALCLLGLSFALAYGPLTMAATDGVAEDAHGLAGGLLYTAMQFGTALGLSAVTAVDVAAGGGLDGLRVALVVPVAAATLGAAVIASGLRTRAGRDGVPPSATPPAGSAAAGSARAAA
ncbi:putative MFS-type transporter EfpA [Actinomadura sp. RB99]|uniref:MFS transporter n=1 Tax=Actinomadura sp. RB99 TaxID=2691577 RepID=UPI0016820B40|nr:MFS transporter [Actinomadura sp. RB99]MBD2900007.1 putative MFS-type transporter EfpA [Actinomadura sp. RB99]